MPRVTFEPFGTVAAGEIGESLFELAKRAGVAIPTACVARATCGLCRVKVIAGEAGLSPQNDNEKKHLGNTYFISKLRLSCQARLTGDDVTVRIPDARKK